MPVFHLARIEPLERRFELMHQTGLELERREGAGRARREDGGDAVRDPRAEDGLGDGSGDVEDLAIARVAIERRTSTIPALYSSGSRTQNT